MSYYYIMICGAACAHALPTLMHLQTCVPMQLVFPNIITSSSISLVQSTHAVLTKGDGLSSPVHLSCKTSVAAAESHPNNSATVDFSRPSSGSGHQNTSEPQLLSSQLNLLQVRDNLCSFCEGIYIHTKLGTCVLESIYSGTPSSNADQKISSN